MSSNSIYSKQYCVYHTIYHGDKLPPNYIGSSSVSRVLNGYHGTVKSKKYKTIWIQEIKKNPQLFETIIISTHDTRPEATYKELQVQKLFNVVTNNLFINMSYATVNGFFTADKSGTNNPMYGKTHSQEVKEILSKHASGKNNPHFGKTGILHHNYQKIWSHETILKRQIANSKITWEIILPDTTIIYIKNMKKYCRENNLDFPTMCKVANGKYKSHKGYSCKRIG